MLMFFIVIWIFYYLEESSSLKIYNDNNNINNMKEFYSKKILVTLSSLSLIPLPVLASTLSEITSILPGMGPPDVFYPNTWEGTWKTQQTFTSVNFTTKDTTTRLIPYIMKKYDSNEPLLYNRVYRKFDDSDRVVLDRSTTSTNMWKAFDKTAICLWSYNNPNVATIQTGDGKIDEYKVMKRSVESGDFFGFSEFSRIAETSVSLQYAIPKIYGSRTLTRYREEGNDVISGLERMYIYDAETIDINSNPLCTIKSKIVMNRL